MNHRQTLLNLQGMIFDLDGTIADTLPVCFEACRSTFLRFLGRRYEDEEIRAMFGPSDEGIVESMIPGRYDEAIAFYTAEYERLHGLCTKAFAGIDQALQILRDNGVPLAIVTGKSATAAKISLRRTGLARWFDCVEAGAKEGNIKPASIRKVLDRWEIEPAQAAYVGDAGCDIHSAREAGVMAIAAAWAPSAVVDELVAADPDALFRTVDRFVSWIRSRVSCRLR